MSRVLQSTPEAFTDRLAAAGGRAWIVRDPKTNELRSSLDWLDDFVAVVADEAAGPRRHDAVFFAVGPRSRTLFAAFVHRGERGQAQGGCRYWGYEQMESLLRDGLRLAVGMGRKSALAGLWWGGGKAIIARAPRAESQSEAERRQVFSEFGDFVSSLRGCYITAEDAGTTPLDVAQVHQHTRFVTCIPPAAGGSGNPSIMTARGVLLAMQAGLDSIGGCGLRGSAIAMQGAGNVGSAMIELLLERGAARVVVSDISEERCSAVRDRFADAPVEVRRCEPGDGSILAEACDVFVPNALGGVLDAKSIADLRTRLVCGAANNPLLDDEADAARLEARGIAYVPDFVANRMGIVNCANEQYGSLVDDPAIQRHFDGPDGWPGSVYNVTRQVLERARLERTTSVVAANQLADELAAEPHPIWGDRAWRIIESLVESGWERQRLGEPSAEEDRGASQG